MPDPDTPGRIFWWTEFHESMLSGKADAAITSGNTGTVSVWDSSSPSDTGENITARNWVGDVTSGAQVICGFDGTTGEWVIVSEKC